MAPHAGRQFKSIFEEANHQLRSTFGCQMTELPQKEKITVSQKRGPSKHFSRYSWDRFPALSRVKQSLAKLTANSRSAQPNPKHPLLLYQILHSDIHHTSSSSNPYYPTTCVRTDFCLRIRLHRPLHLHPLPYLPFARRHYSRIPS